MSGNSHKTWCAWQPPSIVHMVHELSGRTTNDLILAGLADAYGSRGKQAQRLPQHSISVHQLVQALVVWVAGAGIELLTQLGSLVWTPAWG